MAAGGEPTALPPGSVRPRPAAERGRRWFLRPTTFVLTLVCFTLPFLTVSCTKPGAYGRVEAGGSTTYSGYDLAFGGEPHRSADHLLPRAQWRPDDLGVQPLLWIALAFVVAGLVIPFVVRRTVDRERASALSAGLALLAVVGGAWTERVELAGLITSDARARRVVLDHPASTYVGNGQGLVLAVLLMAGTLVVELVLINGRRRSAYVRPPGAGGRDFRRSDSRSDSRSDNWADRRAAPPPEADLPPAPPRRKIGSPWDVDPPVTARPSASADVPAGPVLPASPATPLDPR
jgi:hypothetical protein